MISIFVWTIGDALGLAFWAFLIVLFVAATFTSRKKK